MTGKPVTDANILETILATKREEIGDLRRRWRDSDLQAAARDAPPTRDFLKALHDAEGTALIAEVKKASPSKGLIRTDFDPVAIARAYQSGGASCLSVLTDARYFQGDLAYLKAIRDVVSLPLLRKDFLIDPVQVYESRIAGADAILLIVAAVPSPGRLAELRHVAELLNMATLVEVHDIGELEIALESGATLVGVNNRDLRTFDVRLELSEQILPQLPAGTTGVAESGIFAPSDLRRMREAGARAVLVGESLMREADVTAATERLLALPGVVPSG